MRLPNFRQSVKRVVFLLPHELARALIRWLWMLRVRLAALALVTAFLAPWAAPCLTAAYADPAMPCCPASPVDAPPIVQPCCAPADSTPVASVSAATLHLVPALRVEWVFGPIAAADVRVPSRPTFAFAAPRQHSTVLLI